MSSQVMKRHRGNLKCILLSQGSEVSQVAQSCLTLCDPMDCSLPGFSVHGEEYWSGLPFPSPGDLPNPETEPGSPAL